MVSLPDSGVIIIELKPARFMSANSCAEVARGLMPMVVRLTLSRRRTISSQIASACDSGRLKVESTNSKARGASVRCTASISSTTSTGSRRRSFWPSMSG